MKDRSDVQSECQFGGYILAPPSGKKTLKTSMWHETYRHLTLNTLGIRILLSIVNYFHPSWYVLGGGLDNITGFIPPYDSWLQASWFIDLIGSWNSGESIRNVKTKYFLKSDSMCAVRFC
jgi:hypothetical protein